LSVGYAERPVICSRVKRVLPCTNVVIASVHPASVVHRIESWFAGTPSQDFRVVRWDVRQVIEIR